MISLTLDPPVYRDAKLQKTRGEIETIRITCFPQAERDDISFTTINNVFCHYYRDILPHQQTQESKFEKI